MVQLQVHDTGEQGVRDCVFGRVTCGTVSVGLVTMKPIK